MAGRIERKGSKMVHRHSIGTRDERYAQFNLRHVCAFAFSSILSIGTIGCSGSLSMIAGTAAPTVTSFAGSPAAISAGNHATLSWKTTGATAVTVTPVVRAILSADDALDVRPAVTTTYTLTASNGGGSTAVETTITVLPNGGGGGQVPAESEISGSAQQRAPSITTFAASPTSITAGGASTLTWRVSRATSIAITPGEFTSIAANGSTSVSPSATTTYTLTATNRQKSAKATTTVTVQTGSGSKPTISSFTASPASIASGGSSTLSWATAGATSVAITPGTFKSTSASGSTKVSPTASTSYTLTATNSSGSSTANTTVTVTSTGGKLGITTSSCPGGTQSTAYAGCTITAGGGTPPYKFSVTGSASYPPLPEGLTLNASTGQISSALIGGQGTYETNITVTDAAGASASQNISFSINGSNAYLASIFPSTSIFHHRVDAATTGLAVDTSPAAAIYSGYQSSTIRPFFGNTSNAPFPNGIPAIEVPWNQADVAVSTTEYQSYYTSGPIPAYAPVEGTSVGVQSGGDGHVLVYLEAGNGNTPALYEMWQGLYEGGPWTDSSNALWVSPASNNLTTQGEGTTDAAGLPVSPLLVNADEVIGTGTATKPNGAVQHPIRFTLNHMLHYWVWPATQSAGVGSCTGTNGSAIPAASEISQSTPPASCTMTGPAGEIYRLKASVATPACAATSPQAAIIIQGFRNYGIILADNGMSGGLIGTPDARWNDNDLSCLTSLVLSDFEPVNVSSLIVSNTSGATSH